MVGGGPGGGMARGPVLVIDTGTRRCCVALGDERGLVASSTRETPHRHGGSLLAQLDEVLAAVSAQLSELRAIAVGIVPGSFTGLRVGIASAKTLAWTSALPLVGVATTEALRHAATLRCGPAAAAACVVLPAGAHDHYLDRPGAPAELVPAGRALAIAVGSAPAVAVELRPAAAAGLRGVEGLSAAELGEAAVQGLPAALLDIALPRLACGQVDDPAELVPRYVALPRGVGEVAARMAWSPDLR